MTHSLDGDGFDFLLGVNREPTPFAVRVVPDPDGGFCFQVQRLKPAMRALPRNWKILIEDELSPKIEELERQLQLASRAITMSVAGRTITIASVNYDAKPWVSAGKVSPPKPGLNRRQRRAGKLVPPWWQTMPPGTPISMAFANDLVAEKVIGIADPLCWGIAERDWRRQRDELAAWKAKRGQRDVKPHNPQRTRRGRAVSQSERYRLAA